MRLKYFEKLCIKEITGNINEAERDLLRTELTKSAVCKSRFEELKSIWSLSSPVDISENVSIDNEWNLLSDKFSVLESKSIKEKEVHNGIFDLIVSWLTPNWKPAVIVVVVLFIVASVLLIYIQSVEPVLIIAQTSNKEYKEITFQDGSVAYLNNGSSLTYRQTFDEDIREVKLQGEAFFEVVKDKRKFVVSTSNAKTVVLGTKFNVWSRGDETRVIVEEGKVNIGPNANENKYVSLTKNQLSKIIGRESPTPPKEVNAIKIIGWLNGKLVFNQTPLNEIVEELVRYYDVPVRLEDETISKKSLTGSFDNLKLESVLQMLALSLDLEYEKHDESYIIKQKK